MHEDHSCWEKGIKKSLEKSLNVVLSDDDRMRLNEYLEDKLTTDEQVGTNPA